MKKVWEMEEVWGMEVWEREVWETDEIWEMEGVWTVWEDPWEAREAGSQDLLVGGETCGLEVDLGGQVTEG